MSMEFLVTPDVLVPRPETEFVVESVLESARGREEAPLLIADVGTGSGCIAVSLAARLKNAQIAATDASPQALEVARKNAEKHGVTGRIAFLEGDMLKPLEGGEYAGRIDFLLSNPPYVSEDEWPALPPEVRDYEPKQALLAQGDPLRYYRAICGGAPALLACGGRVVVEVGKGRAEPVKEIFLNGHNFDEVKLVKDYGGIERIVVATEK
jgi:release factor glutamine methyltransferase